MFTPGILGFVFCCSSLRTLSALIFGCFGILFGIRCSIGYRRFFDSEGLTINTSRVGRMSYTSVQAIRHGPANSTFGNWILWRASVYTLRVTFPFAKLQADLKVQCPYLKTSQSERRKVTLLGLALLLVMFDCIKNRRR